MADRTGPSVCHVFHHEGTEQVHFSRETVEELLASKRFGYGHRLG